MMLFQGTEGFGFNMILEIYGLLVTAGESRRGEELQDSETP